MARKVLIVDDNAANRLMLRQMLHGTYDVLEADGGAAALRLLRQQHKFISAILLDIRMPEMDGYEVLRKIRDDIRLNTIPVLVVTALNDNESEELAVSLGAYGFVSKPYSAALILHHLHNAIALRESAAIVNAIRRDKLTQLFNFHGFAERAEQLLKMHEPGYYAISSLDINHFKVINDQYGTAVGDRVLLHVAGTLRCYIEALGGICCRVTADNFAVLFPASKLDTAEILHKHQLVMSPDCIETTIKICVGRYIIDDLSLTINAMYDRAVMAKESIKGRYDVYTAQYNEEMREALLREQKLVSEMEMAFAQGRFEVWIQPQYNHATGALIGAEALVRWRLAQDGRVIQPDAFIPTFERNGFIYKLDKYVWEQTCRLQRRWLDEGHRPLPLSVNVSRCDLLQEDIVSCLLDLVQKYALPFDLLRLEITESAFAAHTEQIVRVAAELIGHGFTVEIDDFGTGYSSLNTLKEVPAQVLKLDLRFFTSNGDSSRGGNIVESVVRMAKWLGMAVIAEGVETIEQAEYLKSIGCYYVQGFLYAHPMSVAEYEVLAMRAEKEEHLITLETVDNLDNNAFWNPESMDTLIFNSYVGAACIFEYHDDNIELLRYSAEFGRQIRSRELRAEAMKLNWAEYLDEENLEKLRKAIDSSITRREATAREFVFRRLPGCPAALYIRIHLRVIAKAAQHCLVYATFENMTALRRAERKAAQAAAKLLATGMTPGSESADKPVPLCDDTDVTAEKQKTEQDAIGRNSCDLLPPELATQFCENDTTLNREDAPKTDFDEAICARDATPRQFQTSKHLLHDADAGLMGVYGINDIKKMRSALEFVTDNIPGGLVTFRYAKGSTRISYFNDGFCALFGGTRAGLVSRGNPDPREWIFDADQPVFFEQLALMEESGTPSNCTFRIHTLDKGFKWVNYKAAAAESRDDGLIVNAILLDVTSEQTVLEQLRISEEENNLAILQGERVVCRYSIADRTLTMAANLAKAYSLPETIENVPEEPVRLGMISPETTQAYIHFFEDILAGSKEGKVLYQQSYFGSWQWVEAKSSTLYASDGKPLRAIISMLDVTERLEKEALYKRWQQSLQNRSENSYSLFRCNLNNDFSYDTKTGSLITFNFESAGKTFSERTAVYAKQMIYEDDRAAYLDFFSVDKMTASYYRGNRSAKLEYRELLPGGGFRWLRVTADLVENAASTAVEAYLMYEDIDRKKRKELQTKKLSETDPLTGLLNRKTFSDLVDKRLHTMMPGVRHATMILDLDGFKQVNDMLGHAAGDQTLIDIARDLSAALRPEDFVARLGGDEFVIFRSDFREDSALIDFGRKICDLARKSLGITVRLSGSVGIAVAPRDGDSFAALYQKMDAALYYVKGTGKDNVAVYHETMAAERPLPGYCPPLECRKKDKKRRILIVDDSPMDITLMEQILKDDYLVEKAKSGPEALIRLRHFGTAVSAVLLDLIMPGMDGFEVLEQLQSNANLRPIPVIVVSGDEGRDTCLKAIRKGATDYVTKPIDSDLLHIRVQSAISKAENEHLRAQNSLLEAQSEERIHYDYVLECAGSTFVEYNWMTGDFLYYPSISNYLAGKFDNRTLWQILLSDRVTDTQTARQMQQLVQRISEAREQKDASLIVKLKTPKKVYHSFRMNVHKSTNDFGLTNKLIITLTDLDYEAS